MTIDQKMKAVECAFAENAYSTAAALHQHYSGLLFKGRLSIVTASIVIWAFLLKAPSQDLDSIKIVNLTVPASLLAAVLASVVNTGFAAIESVYFERLFTLVATGQRLERGFNVDGFFSSYLSPKHDPFYLIYFVNGILFWMIGVFEQAPRTTTVTWLAAVALLIPILLLIPPFRKINRRGSALSKDRESDIQADTIAPSESEDVR